MFLFETWFHILERCLTTELSSIVEHKESARMPDKNVFLVYVRRKIVVVLLELGEYIDIAQIC